MKIYFSHSTNMNYKGLYVSLRKIENASFVLPHEGKAVNSKSIIKECSLMIADVTKPSHGVGIEVGWADSFGIPIILICKKGSKLSGSLSLISKKVIEYKNFEDARHKIEKVLKKWKKK